MIFPGPFAFVWVIRPSVGGDVSCGGGCCCCCCFVCWLLPSAKSSCMSRFWPTKATSLAQPKAAKQQQIEMPLDSRLARHLRKYSIPMASARRGGLYAHISIPTYVYSFGCLIVCSFHSLTHSLGPSKRWNALCLIWGYLRPQLNQLECQFEVNSSTNNPTIQSYHIPPPIRDPPPLAAHPRSQSNANNSVLQVLVRQLDCLAQ